MRFFVIALAFFSLIGCDSGSSSSPIGLPVPGPGPGPGGGRLPGPDEFKFPINSQSCINSFFGTDDWQEELGRRIQFGDGACVKKVIQLGAKANEPIDIDPFSSRDMVLPIHYALYDSPLFFSKTKDLGVGVLKALIEAGADVNARDRQGRPTLEIALSPAVLKDYVNPAAFLIQNTSADLNVVFQDGDTALLTTLARKERQLAELLITRGADVNARTRSGLNSLHIAIRSEFEDIAMTLLQRGVNPTALDHSDNTALHRAAASRMEKLGAAISDKMSLEALNARNKSRETALLLATQVQSVPLVRQLLAKGADANLASDSEMPLHAALRVNADEIINLLLPKTADVNALNADKKSPLHLAVEHASTAQVQALLNRNAATNVLDRSGHTPLMRALSAKDSTKSSLLIPRSNLNLKGVGGVTAIFYAGTVADLKALIAAGADLNSKTDNGQTPMVNFISLRNPDLADELISAGADLSWQDRVGRETLLHLAIDRDLVGLAETLIRRGLKVDATDSTNRTPLFFAESVAAINLLASNQANINQKSTSGVNPLMVKVHEYLQSRGSGSPALVQRLLELKADPNVKNKEGLSLLHITVMGIIWQDSSQPDLLRMLLNHGADVNAIDPERATPLHRADTEEEVKILLEAGANRDLKNIEGKTTLQIREGQQVVLRLEVDRLVDRIAELEAKLAQAKGETEKKILERHLADSRTELTRKSERLDKVRRIVALLKQ